MRSRGEWTMICTVHNLLSWHRPTGETADPPPPAPVSPLTLGLIPLTGRAP
jgi:hypothetical protein